MCSRHLRAWERAGKPDAAGGSPRCRQRPRSPGSAACRIGYCELWAASGRRAVLLPPPALEGLGRPGLEEFITGYEPADRAGTRGPDQAARPAPAGSAVRPAVPARRQHDQDQADHVIRSWSGWLAGSGASSLLDRSEQEWRDACPAMPPGASTAVALLAYAHRKVTAPGRGRRLGQRVPPRRLAAAPPRHRVPVRDPAVLRHLPAVAEGPGQAVDPVAAEHRPGARTCYRGVRARHPVRRVPRRNPASRQPGGISRDVLERYLADLHAALAGKQEHRDHIGQVATFLTRRPPAPLGHRRCPRPR